MQIGLSPKVFIPTLVQAAVGLVLVVVGAVLADETLRQLGYGVLTAAVVTGGAGYAASPGTVARRGPGGPASDELLPRQVRQKIDA